MDVQDPDNEVVGSKSSGLFSLPAAFIKKLYIGSEESVDRSVAEVKINDDTGEEVNFGDIDKETREISKSLVKLIDNTQELFQKNEAFGSIRNMALEISNTNDSNHVLISFVNVLNKVSNKYVIEKQELLFELPVQIIEKFKFSKKYHKQSKKLEKSCEAISSINDLSSCLQSIYELFYNVYQDAYADKEELENFLFNIGAQVGRIGDTLQTVAEEQKSDLHTQGELNLKMNDAVSLISKNIMSGNDLASLKNTVKVQLDTLQNIVDEERKIVKAQEERVNNNVKALVNRVNELNIETQELRDKVKCEKEQALRDPLTGLYNRQAYNEKISEIISTTQEVANHSLLIWDIDHFKKFNDLYGHVVGDKVLKTVAGKLGSLLKERFFLARFGGEEFAMLLPEISLEESKEYAEHVRNEVSNITFILKGKKVKITISCGISNIQKNDTSQTIFERADKALYAAKENGRNCVSVYNNKQY